MKKYESQQLEAVEDAVGEVGEGLGDFVTDIPVVGDAAEDVVGGHTFQNLPFVGDQLEDGVDNIEDPVGDDPGMVE